MRLFLLLLLCLLPACGKKAADPQALCRKELTRHALSNAERIPDGDSGIAGTTRMSDGSSMTVIEYASEFGHISCVVKGGQLFEVANMLNGSIYYKANKP